MVYYPHRDVCKTGLAQHHTFSSKLAVKSTCWQTCTGSELCEPPHLPGCTHKSKLRASKHFPQTITLWCFEAAGGIFQLSGALSLEISTVQWPGQAQSRAAPAIQLRGRAGSQRNGSVERHSSALWKSLFFNSVLSAGRQRWPQGSSFTSAPGSSSIFQQQN